MADLHTEGLHIERLHTGSRPLHPTAAGVLLRPPIVAEVPLPSAAGALPHPTTAGAAVPHITVARLPRPAITDHRAVADHMEAVPTVEVVPMAVAHTAAVLMAEAAAAVDHAVAGKTFSNRTEI